MFRGLLQKRQGQQDFRRAQGAVKGQHDGPSDALTESETNTMSSTKSATGHLLGAAGAIEAIFSILAIRDQVAPPTINLDNPAVETVIDLCANEKRPAKIDIALSNSFGFGGTNASVVFGKVD